MIVTLSGHLATKLNAMADAFRDRIDNSYKEMTAAESTVKNRLDVPEERKYVGFDAYKKQWPMLM